MTPRAVPQSTQASRPALQWVITVSPSCRSLAPCSPMALQRVTSSSAMALASCSASAVISSMSLPSSAFASVRSTPHDRLTAVGRVFFSRSAPALSSMIKSGSLMGGMVRASRAMPKAPAAPRAGAPRTRNARIASCSASRLQMSLTASFSGNAVWSMMIIQLLLSSQSIVRISKT